MALPVTITSSDHPSTRSGHNKPFRSSNGDIYVILLTVDDPAIGIVQDGDLLHIAGQMDQSSTTSASPVAYKATDPTASFAIQDSGGQPTWATDADDGEVWYSRFNMADDTWQDVDTGDPDILAVDVQDPENGKAISITLRSDGDLVIVYQKNRDKFMGIDRPSVGAAVSTDNGINWTGETQISPTGSATDHYAGPVIIPPNNSDQAHIFYIKDDGTPTLVQRAFSGGGTVRTERDTGFTTDVNKSLSGMAFTRGGSDLVKILYHDSGAFPTVYEMIPFSDDTDPTSGDSSVQIVAETANIAALDFVFDPGTETMHELHSDVVTDDIQHHDDQGTDTWQDNGEVVMGVGSITRVYCNIFDRDGAKIGFVYRDGSNIIYNEVDITPSTTALSEVDMGIQNSYQGPFEIGGDFYTIMLIGEHDIVAVKATPASPVDADWNSVDTPIRVDTFMANGVRPGWLYQDPIKSIWVAEDSSDLHVATQQESG